MKSDLEFCPPVGLVWETGNYGHQGRAVFAWEEAGRRGILCMATGAGKTISALIAAWRLHRETRRLLVLIAAPTRPLVGQWTLEAQEFGLSPYAVGSDSKARRMREIDTRLADLELGQSAIEVIIVTNDLLNDSALSDVLRNAAVPVLLIADEVHNLGGSPFLEKALPSIHYRLGLSATPERQYDDAGSQAILRYFGKVVFEFGLSDAIGVCLVPYDYYLHPVVLTHDELHEYRKLSERIRRLFAQKDSAVDDDGDRLLQRLLNRRRVVLEGAAGKLQVLRALLLDLGSDNINHTLIYATDKDPRQLVEVNTLLGERRVRYHQITAAETGNAKLVDQTLAAFKAGQIQVLTAKRVLDEGLNVPEIETAFILASTTVKRQWVQRRGRVLRLCPTIGKDHAVIHDLVVLPPAGEPVDDDVKRLISSELERCDEFTDLARNRAAKGGPREVLQNIRLKYIV